MPDFPLLPALALAAALLLPAASVTAAPPAPKAVTAFQSANMPDTDRKTLSPQFLKDNAARAVKDSPEHAIYASSFRRTGLPFPLVWAPGVQWVSAENVTDRDVKLAADTPADPDLVMLHIRVVDAKGKRVIVPVMVRDLDDTTGNQSGVSTGDTADHNNLLTLKLRRERAYEIIAGNTGHQTRQTFASGKEAMDTVTLALPPVPRPVAALPVASAKALNTALAAYFAAPARMQAEWKFSPKLDALLLQNEGAVRQAAWDAYKAAPIHQAAREDIAANQVRSSDYLSPYIVKTVGTRPPGGWGLVIAMHGGGGAPKELNDSQWHGMATYYNDHPEAGGYKYLALRAPNDTWNGFYDDYVYPLVTRLINEYLVLGDVNPDRIYLIGYSHGGYGAFAIGPKMPDRFASIHASAGAGTDGETAVENLRDVPFSVWVGEFDTMYGRLDRTRALAVKLAEMRGGHPDTYPMSVDIKTGFQHGNLPDHDELAVMLPAVRNPVPRVVTWLMTDTVIHDFYWLHSDAPNKTQRLDASIENNAVVVTATPNVTGASVMLDSRLVDFARPVTLSVNGKLTTQRIAPRLKTLAETLARRGDPRLASTAVLPITAP